LYLKLKKAFPYVLDNGYFVETLFHFVEFLSVLSASLVRSLNRSSAKIGLILRVLFRAPFWPHFAFGDKTFGVKLLLMRLWTTVAVNIAQIKVSVIYRI